MTRKVGEPKSAENGRRQSAGDRKSGSSEHRSLWEDRSKPICVISPSGARRVFGIAMLGLLGAMFIWLGFIGFETSIVAAATFGVLGVGSFWAASIVGSATSASILLLRNGLITSDDIVVAELKNIRAVERGLFALKPSSGFVILLKKPMALQWRPGLWWRFGRRIGIGGATTAAEGKIMADAIQALLIGQAENASFN